MPKIEHSLAQGFGKGELYDLLVAALVDITAQKVIIDELVDDHATFKANNDELVSRLNALATKLNADAGVEDTNYIAIQTANPPAILTAVKTALTVTS